MKARHPILALIAVAVAITLTSVAAARPDAAKQRVAINLKGGETFVLLPLQTGALKRDSGSTTANIGTNTVAIHEGQRVELWRPTFTLKGKRGTLTIRERIDWTDTGDAFIGFGTWKVVSGTGEYAGVTGGGRTAHVGHNHGNGNWFIREEGYLTVP